MKRGAVHFTWEFLKKRLGLDKVYCSEIRPDGIMFHEYGGDIQHAEGSTNCLVERVDTVNFKESSGTINVTLTYQEMQDLLSQISYKGSIVFRVTESDTSTLEQEQYILG